MPKTFEVTLEFLTDSGYESDICRGVLETIGVAQEDITELFKSNSHTISIYFKSAKKVEIFRRKFKQLSFKKVKLRTKSLIDKEWKTKWKDEFKPFRLTRQTYVIPSWLKGKHPKKSGGNIYIDSTVAFGTGLHATTQFMSEFVEMKQQQIESFLDLGTGTGILSILASQVGAKYVAAVDISEQAVVTARYNFKSNNVIPDELICSDLRKLSLRKKFDYVAANIITDEILITQKKILKFVKPGGYLAVSGISLNNYPRFRKEFDEDGLTCLRVKRGEGWSAILYKKTS